LLEIVWAEESCPVHSQARLPAIKPELRRPGTEADPSWDAPQKELERFLILYPELEWLQRGRTSGAGRSVGQTSEQDDTNGPNLPAAAGEERAAALRACMIRSLPPASCSPARSPEHKLRFKKMGMAVYVCMATATMPMPMPMSMVDVLLRQLDRRPAPPPPLATVARPQR
jgi:hypothetical protein